MKRTVEVVSRHDWDRMVATLDGEVMDDLMAELEAYAGGDTCEAVEYSADYLGRIDSESNPRPADRD